MPATHHSSALPTTSTPPAPTQSTDASSASRAHDGPPAPTAPPPENPSSDALHNTPAHAPSSYAPSSYTPTLGRIPVIDVRPTVHHGRRPAKAVVGEAFEISAVVFREGHDAVAANVVLRDREGRPGPWTPMRELAPGTDRWGATVSAPSEGLWTYAVEGWGDPVATWRHHAQIKIPAGIDTELVLEGDDRQRLVHRLSHGGRRERRRDQRRRPHRPVHAKTPFLALPWKRSGSGPFQRCRSRVRTSAAIDVIRFRLHRAPRKIRQDFSRATPRSTGARAADSARLTVC